MKLSDIIKKDTLIIAGFPGIGKSYFKKNIKRKKVLDSDSMSFSWSDAKHTKRNANFPKNYIEHIKNNIGKVDIILISTHDEVRDALEDNKMNYTLIYPDIALKDEYKKRYKDRKSDEKFIEFIIGDWDKLIQGLVSEKYPKHVVLKEGEYLGDVIS